MCFRNEKHVYVHEGISKLMESMSFDNTYSPVLKATEVRIMISLMLLGSWRVSVHWHWQDHST